MAGHRRQGGADHGVKIGIENCPMIFSYDEWPGGNNLMHTPATWRTCSVPSTGDTLGLNLDPSHLVWQMIDYERVVREFGERIYHVHAKDMEIDREGLYEHGVLSAGMGWQMPRLPGLGEVRWDRFIAALYRAGYDYAIVVEHEDRQFEGSDEKVKAGFLIARNGVRPTSCDVRARLATNVARRPLAALVRLRSTVLRRLIGRGWAAPTAPNLWRRPVPPSRGGEAAVGGQLRAEVDGRPLVAVGTDFDASGAGDVARDRCSNGRRQVDLGQLDREPHRVRQRWAYGAPPAIADDESLRLELAEPGHHCW